MLSAFAQIYGKLKQNKTHFFV